MLGRKTIVSLLVVVVAVVALVAFSGTSGAQTGTPVAFENVQAFTYPSGLTAFFDSNTGMLYVYDKNWDKCIGVHRVNQLGSPLINVTPRR